MGRLRCPTIITASNLTGCPPPSRIFLPSSLPPPFPSLPRLHDPLSWAPSFDRCSLSVLAGFADHCTRGRWFWKSRLSIPPYRTLPSRSPPRHHAASAASGPILEPFLSNRTTRLRRTYHVTVSVLCLLQTRLRNSQRNEVAPACGEESIKALDIVKIYWARPFSCSAGQLEVDRGSFSYGTTLNMSRGSQAVTLVFSIPSRLLVSEYRPRGLRVAQCCRIPDSHRFGNRQCLEMAVALVSLDPSLTILTTDRLSP